MRGAGGGAFVILQLALVPPRGHQAVTKCSRSVRGLAREVVLCGSLTNNQTSSARFDNQEPNTRSDGSLGSRAKRSGSRTTRKVKKTTSSEIKCDNRFPNFRMRSKENEMNVSSFLRSSKTVFITSENRLMSKPKMINSRPVIDESPRATKGRSAFWL